MFATSVVAESPPVMLTLIGTVSFSWMVVAFVGMSM